MSKKKLKKMLRKAMKNGNNRDMANAYQTQGGFGEESGYGNGNGFASGFELSGDDGRLGRGLRGSLGLPRGFGTGQTEQFIIGALLGAVAAYVLADEELRGKIMKSMVKLYSGLAGGLEEFKEQMSDLKAEIEAGHGD